MSTKQKPVLRIQIPGSTMQSVVNHRVEPKDVPLPPSPLPVQFSYTVHQSLIHHPALVVDLTPVNRTMTLYDVPATTEGEMRAGVNGKAEAEDEEKAFRLLDERVEKGVKMGMAHVRGFSGVDREIAGEFRSVWRTVKLDDGDVDEEFPYGLEFAAMIKELQTVERDDEIKAEEAEKSMLWRLMADALEVFGGPFGLLLFSIAIFLIVSAVLVVSELDGMGEL